MSTDLRKAVRVTRPTRTAFAMLAFLVVVGVLGFLLARPISAVFLANIYLNSLIAFVFLVGTLYTFWQVFRLNRCVDWIEAFISERPGLDAIIPPRLLASMAGMLRDRQARQSLSATTSQAILDSIATRLDESREIARYLINLLIFLGLLGTFWGLSITVPEVVATISNLAPSPDESADEVFSRLIGSLGRQMDGLGTAFASSLMGLAGFLVLGFLEILSGHAQNRFYREIEEALANITNTIRADGEGATVLGAALDRNSVVMSDLLALIWSQEERAQKSYAALENAAAALDDTTSRLRADGDALQRLTESQDNLRQTLGEAIERNRGVIGGMDEATRTRIQNMDVHLLRIAEEIGTGRAETTAALRTDIKALSETLIAAARGDYDDRRG